MSKNQATAGSVAALCAAIAVSVAILILVPYVGIRLVATAMPESVAGGRASVPAAAAATTTIAAEADAKERLDHYIAIGNNVTAFVIAVAGLFAVVGVLLTGWSIFIAVGLQRIKDDAEKEIHSLRARVHETNPELEGLGRAIQRLLVGIESLLAPGMQWGNAGYAEMPPHRIEAIALAELHLAGLEAFDLGRFEKHREPVARANRVLGRFYTSRYFAGRCDELADWYRSGIYLARAEDLTPTSAVLSDIGTQLLAVDVKAAVTDPCTLTAEFLRAQREKAAAKLRRSLELDPKDVNALYGLGWISMALGDETGDYRDALSYYERIVDQPLSGEIRRKYLSNAYFNCACCVWRDRHANDRKRRTLWYLGLSLKAATESDERPLWEHDFENDPDLATFRTEAKDEIRVMLG